MSTTTSPVSLLALHAAAIAARGTDAERVAADALFAAMAAAPWGAQPDGTFLTHTCEGSWWARWGTTYELHAPARSGVIATLTERHDGEPDTSLVYTREDARVREEEVRAWRRQRAAAYESRRQTMGAALLRGEALPYGPGEKGGVVGPLDERGIHIHEEQVSAMGALRAAGVTGADAEDLLRAAGSLDYRVRVLRLPPWLRSSTPALRGRGRRRDLRIVTL